jgi:hypothetical protein
VVTYVTTLARRLRSARGRIVLGVVWLACATSLAAMVHRQAGQVRAVGVARGRVHAVRAPYDGIVQAVHAEPGDSVEPGAPLLDVEEPGLAQRVAAAEITLRAIEADRVAEGADRARRFARDAEGARARAVGARVELERARAGLVGLEARVARLDAAGDAAAPAEGDAPRMALAAARAELEARAREVAAWDAAASGAATRRVPDASLLRSAVDAAAIELDALRARLRAGRLVAAARGVLGPAPAVADSLAAALPGAVGRLPAPGDWCAAGSVLAVLIEPVAREVVVYVDPLRRSLLRPGGRATVHAVSGALAATVVGGGAATERVPDALAADPRLPEWGVPITVQVDGALVPGDSVSVDFTR